MSERVIPGLTGPNASKASSKRSRPKSTKQPGSGPNASTAKDAPADASTTQPHNGPHKAAGLTLNPDALLVPQDALVDLPAKIPASQTVGKRIKAVQKKLQRIQGYAEADQATLNEDQKRAIASKPVLEATVKELQDVVKLLEQDESEQDKHAATRAAHEEQRVQSRISLAVHESTKQSQSETTLLLQFFHLNSLFSPDPGFNPPNLPAVVQNASGQEAAAVKSLAEAFINGPLLGGGDDAFERISKLAGSDESEVVEGVTYGRIKQMILDLTAAPGEVTAADEGSVMGEARALNGHAEGTSEEPAQGDTQGQGQGFTFMQASEIEPPQVQDENNNASSSSPWNQEPAAPLVQAPTEEAMQHLEGGAAAESWGSPAGPVDAAVSSWADDVEEASQPVVAPPPTAAATGQGAAPEKSSSRGLRRGGGGQREGRGRGRGGSRGGPRASKAQIVGEGDGWVQVSHEQQSNTPNRGRGNRGRGQRGRSGGQARAGAHQTAST